jgi:predicted dehydrogenase
MEVRRFAIVGGGFRAQAFLRVARQLPAVEACGVVVRDPVKGAELESRWDVPTCRDITDLLRSQSPDFVVVAVPPGASEEVITQVVGAGMPVLAETPPATDPDGLARLHELVRAGARIQVAEQYHLEPLVSAQIAIARSGLLGTVTEAFVSVCHDYHGLSLIRRLLGVTFEDAVVTGAQTTSTVTAGPGRYGDPQEHRLIEERHVTARLDFGDRVGTYDFSTDQYRSWIRSGRLLVRGDRGELREETVRRIEDFDTPVRMRIERLTAGGPGNHEGLFLRGLTLGDQWLYRNEFAPARLADDELAIASLLDRMRAYVDGGPEVYSLAEACQDHYLQLAIRRAVETGETVRTEPQPWSVAAE